MDYRLTQQFVTVPQAAIILGLGNTKTYEMAASGELPSKKFGRSVRIPVSALEAIARECAASVTPKGAN